MYSAQDFNEATRQLVSTSHFLYEQGWSPATSSNYSLRLDASHIAITVSGKHKGELTQDDIMVVDLAGNPVNTDKRPSAETLLHTVLYAMFDNVNAVLHTHSQAATVLSRLHTHDHIIFSDYELQKAFPGVHSHEGELNIPVFANTQDIQALARETEHYFKQHPEVPAYFIRGHGLYTWGDSLKDALRHIEAMEFLTACELDIKRLTI